METVSTVSAGSTGIKAVDSRVNLLVGNNVIPDKTDAAMAKVMAIIAQAAKDLVAVVWENDGDTGRLIACLDGLHGVRECALVSLSLPHCLVAPKE